MTKHTHPADLRAELAHCLTRYDRRQAGRPGYNPNALGLYLLRADEVYARVTAGEELPVVLADCFNDRLLTHCQQWFSLPVRS